MTSYSFNAVIFDMDGVVTKTAVVHANAWKEMFDEYMKMRAQRDGESFREFTHEGDYLPYVDGKPRYNGVKDFLSSRGINIPFGDPSDPPDRETVCGLGNKKNIKLREVLKSQGVAVFPSTVSFIQSLKKAGIAVGVASSSKNCRDILEAAGIAELFETRVDGVVSAEQGLQGKPEGDIFVTAAANVGAVPATSVVVEDASSGVAAGRNGGFGLVLGVAREDNEQELLDNGADLVVRDLEEFSIDKVEAWFLRTPEDLFDVWEKKAKNVFLSDKKPVLFLDYDGTLTPIVSRPDLAVLSDEMREVICRLAATYTTAVVSGRQREDVENLVAIEGFFYAGSHGFDILGPGFSMINPTVKDMIPLVDVLIRKLKENLGGIPGLLVEEKKFSVAVHYRLVDEETYLPEIKLFVDKLVDENPSFRLMHGKKVFEILPAMDWNKGKAIRWIMKALNLSWDKHSIVYIGDDTTDEDAFRVVRTRGTGILVCDHSKPSSADFQVSTPDDIRRLFEKILEESEAENKAAG